MKRIKNIENLCNHGKIKVRTDAVTIMEKGLEAADPFYNTYNVIKLENDELFIGNDKYLPIGDPHEASSVFDLKKDIDRIFIVGAGKGIQRIAKALEEILGDYLTGGFIIVKHGDEVILDKVTVRHGGHPIPDVDCVSGCKDMLSFIRNQKMTCRDLVFVVIGNGVSSLLTLPPDTISLDSVKKVTQVLQIQLGLPTLEINKVRNQVDLLKGGRITKELMPANIIHLFGIDINERFASGLIGYDAWTKENIWLHSLPDSSSPEKAISYLKEKNAWNLMSEDIRFYLENEAKDHPVLSLEEFKENGGRFFGIMPKSESFVPVVMNECRRLGYEPHHMCSKTNSEASTTGAVFGQIAKNIALYNTPFEAPCALIVTGELQVAVGDGNGIGGRNQEFSLSAARIIDGVGDIAVAAADTDGTDGPGGLFNDQAATLGCKILAGGITDSLTLSEAKIKGVDVNKAISSHSTSDALWRLDSGIWATQNISVNDLIVILIDTKS